MGKALIACLLLAGCQGMYTAPADTLKNPPKVKPKGGGITQADPVYVDECDVNFSAAPTKKRQTAAAQQLVASGNASLQTAGPASPTTQVAASATVDAIDHYREALIKDPYNAEATLKLALAYDHMMRKGCAIAMLKRLESLAENEKFKPEARPNIQLVKQNDHWFRGYRVTALKAIGY